ncbi:MAG: hypothetical protein ABW214_03890 [Terrimicrobiaceae bacterium]
MISCWLFGLATVSSAATLAFAGVLPLACILIGFATALPFTVVFSLAGMRAFLCHGLQRNPSWSWLAGCKGADGHRSGHQTGHSGAREECFRCIHLVLLVFASEFLNLWRSATLRRSKFGECVPSGPLTKITLHLFVWSLENFLWAMTLRRGTSRSTDQLYCGSLVEASLQHFTMIRKDNLC